MMTIIFKLKKMEKTGNKTRTFCFVNFFFVLFCWALLQLKWMKSHKNWKYIACGKLTFNASKNSIFSIFYDFIFGNEKQEFMLKGVKCLHDVLTFLMAKWMNFLFFKTKLIKCKWKFCLLAFFSRGLVWMT